MDGDAERQAAELCALRSIYAADEFGASDDGRVWTALVGREPWRCELHLHIPAAYPSLEPPAPLVEARWLPAARVHALCDELAALHAESPGVEVGFGWISHAQAFVRAEADGLAAARAAASAEDDARATAHEALAGQTDAAHALAAAAAAAAAPAIFSGEPLTDRKSTFQAHACRVRSVAEVHAALAVLRADRKVSRATHNQFAWRLYDAERGAQLHDNDDDGEAGAGVKLSELLELARCNDVLVVVSRWYGGVQLGADRFRHIVSTARAALDGGGLLPAKQTAAAQATSGRR
jgi:hypothetical protein